jgi:beta-phosphoglucomutase-like phosphatase (HAD superfamily)
MDADQITNELMGNVYTPAFLKAAAAHGLEINNEQDLEACLKMAASIRIAEEQAMGEANPVLKQASAALCGDEPQVKQSSSVDIDAIASIPGVAAAIDALSQQ